MTDINVGQLAESINNKLDRDGNNAGNPCYILKTAYVNGTSGYNIWSNGYCEQWGVVSATSSVQTVSVTFLKTFSNTNYILTGGIIGQNTTINASNQGAENAYTKTSTGFTCWIADTTYTKEKDWKASGYLAEGQY